LVNILELEKKIEKFWDKILSKNKDLLATLPKTEDLSNIELTRVERDNLKHLTSMISYLNKLLKGYGESTIKCAKL